MIAVVLGALLVAAPAPPRERLSIDAGWRFHLGDPSGTRLAYDAFPELPGSVGTTTLKPWILPTGNAFVREPARRHPRPEGEAPEPPCARPDFDDGDWSRVDLPHDWAIAGPFLTTGNYGGMGRLKTWGPAWYRRALDIPASDRSRSVFLDVDGAMAYATVWLNGRLVGGWPYGYASWRVDLTPYVVPGGENQLAIRLETPPDSARWYPGAGLYRNVWLVKTERVHVGQWGVRVTTPEVSPASATVHLAVAVDNDAKSDADVEVAAKLFALDGEGQRTGRAVAAVAPIRATVSAGTSTTVSTSVAIACPRLWGPPPTQRPNRYVVVITVTQNGRETDREETPFGVRKVEFAPNRGILVNGEHISLHGVNDHHDLGAIGAAFNVRAAERQLETLRAMGVNALRMSHNPPAPELLDLADRMGFLVVDEIFDCWRRKKTDGDFHLIFDDWHEPDLRAMLRRDRNHPSVFLWSVGNEVGEQFEGEAGATIGRELVAIAHDEDPTRPTMTAMNWSKPGMPLPGAVDVISLNYQGIGIRAIPGNFPEFHAAYPDKVLLSSESAAALSSRGEYQFPVPSAVSAPVRTGAGGDPVAQQVSAYELFAADFGTSADRSFAAHDANPYVAGEFVWTGWDYLGEPTPYYGARSSYFGSIDLAGFPKDRFYLYQSHWRPELPMAHILPHWTWPGREGQVTPVHVFTSGDEAELFVNGRSQGRKRKGPGEYRLHWDDVVYQPGEVSVVAYKGGQEWARDRVRTAGAAARLVATANRRAIAADGKDLAFVTVRIVDRKGALVPRAKDRVRFALEGPGEIVATDNGDPTNFEPFPSSARNAFNGLCLVIVRAKPGVVGRITLHAEAKGLERAAVELQSHAPIGVRGVRSD